MKEGIDSFFDGLGLQFSTLLPQLIKVVAILVIGYLLGKLIEKIVRRFIIYLNQSINSQLNQRLLNVDLKNSANFISKAFFWFIMLIAFFTCMKVLELDFVDLLFNNMIGYLPNVLIAVIIIFFGIVVGRLLGELIKSTATKAGIANGNYLGTATRYIVLFISIDIAVGQLGIDIAFLNNLFIIVISAILLGAALAFGFGARSSVSNILGAYYTRKSYEVGSRIKYETVEGTIIKISDHAIHVETKSGIEVIPAQQFSKSKVTIIKEG